MQGGKDSLDSWGGMGKREKGGEGRMALWFVSIHVHVHAELKIAGHWPFFVQFSTMAT